MPRFFVHFAHDTPHEFYDRAEEHGRVVEVRLMQDPHGGLVYGSAEIEPYKENADGHEDC